MCWNGRDDWLIIMEGAVLLCDMLSILGLSIEYSNIMASQDICI